MSGGESGPQPEMVRADRREQRMAPNLLFNERVTRLRGQRTDDVFNLGFGQSPFPVMPELCEALKTEAHQGAYLPVAGLESLRSGIAGFHRKFDGLELSSERIVVGPGSKQLIFLLLRCFSGEVILGSPSWPTYRPQCELAALPFHHFPTDASDLWKINPKRLEKFVVENCRCRYKMLILCNPDNPTGACYDAAELRAISDVCRRHAVLIVSDEIYARLRFAGEHVAMSKIYPEGSIVSSGISKWAGAGGWRLGYLVFPRELASLQRAVVAAASQTHSCAPAPQQFAAAKILKENLKECAEYCERSRRVLRAVHDFVVRRLTAAGISVRAGSGAYYLFPDFEFLREALAGRAATTAEETFHLLQEQTGVALLGGYAFHREARELSCRLCYVDFDGGRALVAAAAAEGELDDGFVEEFCGPTFAAVEKLCSWAEKMRRE